MRVNNKVEDEKRRSFLRLWRDAYELAFICYSIDYLQIIFDFFLMAISLETTTLTLLSRLLSTLPHHIALQKRGGYGGDSSI